MRTSDVDQNLLSFNKNSIVYFAGTSKEYEVENIVPTALKLLPENPKEWDAILKISGRENMVILNVEAAQGKENVVDINNQAFGIELDGKWGVTGSEGEQVFTIKGASHNVKIGGTVYSTGKRADVICGLWSDQSFDVTHDIKLFHLVHSTGRPLTAILCRVNSPFLSLFGKSKDILLPPTCKILFWKSLGAQIHWWFKFLLVKTNLIRFVKI